MKSKKNIRSKGLLYIISLMLGVLILSTPVFALEEISIDSNTKIVLDGKVMTRTTQQAISTYQETRSVSEFTYMEYSKYIKITGYTGERQDVILPSEINGKPVTAINSRVFKDNTNLLRVSIPNSITTIGMYAFQGCTNLKSISIPTSVVTIDGSAFQGCTSLEEVKIPNGIITIGGSAFQGCTSLKSITIPNSVTTIGISAFKDCINLQSVTLSNSIKTIAGSVFKDCINLKSIDIPDGITKIDSYAFQGCINLENTSIPNSVTTIGMYTFQGCISLEKLILPSNIKSISISVLQDCTNLKEIEIPMGITTIGTYAFKGCSSLETISIPDSISSIASGLFSNCTALKTISIPNSVTSIDSSAFFRCTSLVNIQIPNSVLKLGTSVFYECSSLKEVKIPEGIKLIDGTMFDGCTSLEVIYLPDSITTIAKGAFEGCSALLKMKIPAGVTVIDDRTFYRCVNLKEVDIHEGITKIGSYAFADCKSLVDVCIPQTVATVGNSAFSDCTSLIEINIPENMTTIGSNVFEDCSNLKKVYIPKAVTSIHSYAFYRCGQVVIYGYANSYAESYAKTKKIPFIAMDMEINPEVIVEFNPYNILNDGMMNLQIKITNTGKSSIELENFKVEYYYTNDNDMEQKIYYQYAGKGNTNNRASISNYLQVQAIPMEEATALADTYVNVEFDKDAGYLLADNHILINLVIYNDNYLNDSYILENDHSYITDNTIYEDEASDKNTESDSDIATSYSSYQAITNSNVIANYNVVASSSSQKCTYGVKPSEQRISYVFYDPDDFKNQAKAEAQRIAKKAGYSSKKGEKVILIPVKTEKEFNTLWGKMPSYEIDYVALAFHGTYYTVNIDDKKDEYLTTSPDGLTKYDTSATDIRTLAKKKINNINILTCNNGLLDAIDTKCVFENKSLGVSVTTKGNVAQAFLESQDVKVVNAFDGSLGYKWPTYETKISNEQHIDGQIELIDQAKARVITPQRKSEFEPWGNVTYKKNANGIMSCEFPICIIGNIGTYKEGSIYMLYD